MTTAPTNEMLALADAIDSGEFNFGITSRRNDLVRVLRLAATPARDVREACKAVAKRIGEVAERNIKDGTECCLATVANTCDDIIQGIDNLDAATPAAGGDANERISRLAADLVVSGWMAGDHGIERAKQIAERKLLDFACDEIERHMKSAAPPLQAPADSDALRDMPPTQEYVLRAMVKNYADGNLWDHLDREVCTKAADEIKSLRAALTAPAAMAPAVSEADVAGPTYRIDHDGFEGVKIGTYTTLEGKRGVVLQQVGTRVVHVYGEKWLKPIQSAAQGGGTESDVIVQCPDCEGSGAHTIVEAGCCNNPTRTGECCGNAIPVPGTQECQSCGGSGSIPCPSDPPSQEASAPPIVGGR